MYDKFIGLFQGLDRSYGIYPKPDLIEKGVKHISSKRKTVLGPVTDELYINHLEGENGLGIVPINDDAECIFGCIDIDDYTKDYTVLQKTIVDSSLPLIVCKTKSGGRHLYLFLKQWTDAKEVVEILTEWAIQLGYPRVEIFPKQIKLDTEREDSGSWINLPYFDHAGENKRYAIVEEQPLNLQEFVDYAEKMRVDLADMEDKKPKGIPAIVQGAPPCLQALHKNGIKDFRNNSLYNFGIYLKKKYSDDWQSRLEKINSTIVNDPINSQEMQMIISSLKKDKDYFYKCNDQPICDLCNRSACFKRKYGIGNSSELNVELSNLRKLNSNPPVWTVDVNKMAVTLDDTESLLQQARFNRIVVDKINILPVRLKNAEWFEIINGLLANVEEIEAPLDAGDEGTFLTIFMEWAERRLRTENIDVVRRGQCFHNKVEGRIYFKSTDMQAEISRTSLRIRKNLMWHLLQQNLDAKEKPCSVSGTTMRLWHVREFDIQKEQLTVPEVPEM